MAEERPGGVAAHSTAVSVADGGTERGTAKGVPSDERAKHEINESRLQKNLCFSGEMWYHWIMRNDKKQTTSNEEMVTISRAEYENMQAQIQ